MKRVCKIVSILCLATIMVAISATAKDCKNVEGKISETIVPAPNDPFGRILGTVKGVLHGATTAIITSFVPFPPAPFIPLTVTTLDVFVTVHGDMLVGTGAGTFTPIPGKPPGEFTDNLTVTIIGGSGKYAGATGTITFSGEGHNVFGGPGVGTFDLSYTGSVCTPSAAKDPDPERP